MIANLCGLCDVRLLGRSATAYLCADCTLDTALRLERLPEMFEEVADLTFPARRIEGTRRGSRPAVSPTPDLEPLAVRWNFGALSSWHRLLAEDSGWPVQETGLGIAGDDARVLGACIALRASMRWIAVCWPVAGDFARVVKDLFDGTRSVTGVADLPARMGRCPKKVDGVLCGAELLLPDGQQILRCAWCGSTYPPGVWPALRLAQKSVFEAKPDRAKAS